LNLINFHIDIDLLHFKDQLITKVDHNKVKLFDIIRKKYLTLQPEEIVRQLCILWLIEDQKFSRNNIQVEKTIDIHGLQRRFDIVVYDKSIFPYILVECKAPQVKITQSTFDQISAYQWVMRAPYLMVTNGSEHYIAKMDEKNKKYEFFSEVPCWH
jgi:hypothetical protein